MYVHSKKASPLMVDASKAYLPNAYALIVRANSKIIRHEINNLKAFHYKNFW